jgi:hypothetical protein
MSDRSSVTDDDEGKTVVNANGEKIGVVSGVRGGRAYVDPDPGITTSIRSKLGWQDVDEDDYPLPETSIDEITADQIRLEQDL